MKTTGDPVGSKSPFTLVESFNVESFKNGAKYTCLWYTLEDGTPSLIITDVQPTTEPNGLKFVVPFKEQDFDRIKLACKNQLFHFPIKPRFFKDLNVETSEIKDLFTTDTVQRLHTDLSIYRFKNNTMETIYPFYISVAGVVYPYNLDIRNSKYKDFYTYIYSTSNYYSSLILEMPIGSLTIPMSREAIEATEANTTKISTKFDSIVDLLVKEHFKSFTQRLSNHSKIDLKVFLNEYCKELKINGDVNKATTLIKVPKTILTQSLEFPFDFSAIDKKYDQLIKDTFVTTTSSKNTFNKYSNVYDHKSVINNRDNTLSLNIVDILSNPIKSSYYSESLNITDFCNLTSPNHIDTNNSKLHFYSFTTYQSFIEKLVKSKEIVLFFKDQKSNDLVKLSSFIIDKYGTKIDDYPLIINVAYKPSFGDTIELAKDFMNSYLEQLLKFLDLNIKIESYTHTQLPKVKRTAILAQSNTTATSNGPLVLRKTIDYFKGIRTFNVKSLREQLVDNSYPTATEDNTIKVCIDANDKKVPFGEAYFQTTDKVLVTTSSNLSSVLKDTSAMVTTLFVNNPNDLSTSLSHTVFKGIIKKLNFTHVVVISDTLFNSLKTKLFNNSQIFVELNSKLIQDTFDSLTLNTNYSDEYYASIIKKYIDGMSKALTSCYGNPSSYTEALIATLREDPNLLNQHLLFNNSEITTYLQDKLKNNLLNDYLNKINTLPDYNGSFYNLLPLINEDVAKLLEIFAYRDSILKALKVNSMNTSLRDTFKNYKLYKHSFSIYMPYNRYYGGNQQLNSLSRYILDLLEIKTL